MKGKEKKKSIYKAMAATTKAASPRNPERVVAEAPEDGEIGPVEGDGVAGLLTPTAERLAQAMRPPALLWMTIERLPTNAPIPRLVEM